jgi:hypothetical protein
LKKGERERQSNNEKSFFYDFSHTFCRLRWKNSSEHQQIVSGCRSEISAFAPSAAWLTHWCRGSSITARKICGREQIITVTETLTALKTI